MEMVDHSERRDMNQVNLESTKREEGLGPMITAIP